MIYMNNAATSWPKPDCVSKAAAAALLSAPGSMHRGGLESFDVFLEVRKMLAPLLGITDCSNIALGPNATWGLNLALFGFPLRKEDHVVTTKAEHNSVLRPLYQLAHTLGIHVHYLDTDADGRVAYPIWKEAMESIHPRLAVFTHASNVTGAVHDAAAMTEAAKKQGAAVLIDASQTLGLLPVHAQDIGADMVAFTGHKYLLGPQGTGGLWVSPKLILNPHLVGGTGIHSDSDLMPDEMPLHLEAGTGNEPSFHGLLAALKWQSEYPVPFSELQEKTHDFQKRLRQLGATVIMPSGLCTPVTSFTLPGESPADVGYILQESYDIICRTGIHCAPKIFSCLPIKESVRLSFSRFTTEQETTEVIAALKDVIG